MRWQAPASVRPLHYGAIGVLADREPLDEDRRVHLYPPGARA